MTFDLFFLVTSSTPSSSCLLISDTFIILSIYFWFCYSFSYTASHLICLSYLALFCNCRQTQLVEVTRKTQVVTVVNSLGWLMPALRSALTTTKVGRFGLWAVNYGVWSLICTLASRTVLLLHQSYVWLESLSRVRDMPNVLLLFVDNSTSFLSEHFLGSYRLNTYRDVTCAYWQNIYSPSLSLSQC